MTPSDGGGNREAVARNSVLSQIAIQFHEFRDGDRDMTIGRLPCLDDPMLNLRCNCIERSRECCLAARVMFHLVFKFLPSTSSADVISDCPRLRFHLCRDFALCLLR